jgi:hypothetical protein
MGINSERALSRHRAHQSALIIARPGRAGMQEAVILTGYSNKLSKNMYLHEIYLWFCLDKDAMVPSTTLIGTDA